MPQVYTDLNPNAGIDLNPKANLKVSQGFQADTSTASLIKGASDVLDMGVKLVDDTIQRRIKEEAYQGIDAVRKEFGVDAVATTQANASTRVLPQDLQNSFEQIKELQMGRAQGTIKDSHYWGRLETVSRQLRARYPGYREEIDKTVAGISGGNPANRIVAELATELAQGTKMTEEQKFQQQWEKENEAYLGGIGYFEAKKAGKPIPFQDARILVARTKANKENISLKQSELELMSKQDAAYNTQVEKVARTDINLSVGTALLPALQGLDKIKGKADEEITRLGALTPETEQATRSAFGQVRTQALEVVNQRLMQKAYIDLSPAAKEAIRKDALAQLDATTEAYTNKEYGTFQVRANNIKATTENSELIALKDPHLAAVSTINKIAGPTVANEFWRTLEKTDPDVTSGQKLYRDISASRLVSGQSNIPQEYMRLKEKGADDKTIRATVKGGLEFLKNPNLPPEVFNNTVNSYFGPNVSVDSVLSMGATKKDRRMIYETWTQPEIAKRIQDEAVRTGDQRAWNNYSKWVTNGFATVFNSELSDLKNKYTADNTVEVKFDKATLTFQAVPRTPPQGEFGLTGSQQQAVNMAGTVARAFQSDQLAGINGAIKSMMPVWKATGVDPMVGIDQIMKASSIDQTNIKEPSGMTSAFKMINETWLGQAIRTESGARAKAKEDSMLRLSLSDYENYFKENPEAAKVIDERLAGSEFSFNNIGDVIKFLDKLDLPGLTTRQSKNVEDRRNASSVDIAKAYANAALEARARPQGNAEDVGLTNPEDLQRNLRADDLLRRVTQ